MKSSSKKTRNYIIKNMLCKPRKSGLHKNKKKEINKNKCRGKYLERE